MGNLRIRGTASGAEVRLGDIATLRDGYEDEDDPLRHFEPERFNRRDVNAELKREWAEQKADGAEELQEAHDRGRRWGPADAFWVCLSRTGEIAVL